MGYTRGGRLPAGITFFGRAWSEPTLIKLAYAYEQATHHRRRAGEHTAAAMNLVRTGVINLRRNLWRSTARTSCSTRPKPEQLRAMLRDVFGFKHVDAGGGWLIFALPPAEIGVHPAEGPTGSPGTRHQFTFMCDNIDETIAELKGKGVEVIGEPKDRATASRHAATCRADAR